MHHLHEVPDLVLIILGNLLLHHLPKLPHRPKTLPLQLIRLLLSLIQEFPVLLSDIEHFLFKIIRVDQRT